MHTNLSCTTTKTDWANFPTQISSFPSHSQWMLVKTIWIGYVRYEQVFLPKAVFNLLIPILIAVPILWILSTKLIPISYMKTRLCQLCLHKFAFLLGFWNQQHNCFLSLNPSRDSWHCEWVYMFCFGGYIKIYNYSWWSSRSQSNHKHTHGVIKEQTLRKVSL